MSLHDPDALLHDPDALLHDPDALLRYPDALLRGLDGAQAAAVCAQGSPLVIVAGAGTGKTRTLTRRIAWQVAEGRMDPRHVLAVTFTRKAAEELRERLSELGLRDAVTAGTFHALALSELRRHARLRGTRPAQVVGTKAPLLRAVLERSGDAAAGAAVAEIAGEIEWAKARLVNPGAYPDAALEHRRRTRLAREEIGSLYASYEAARTRSHLLDLEDLITELGRVLETDDELRSSVHWRWRHIFVDEVQDLNPAQGRLLHLWTGPTGELCAVGDPRQAVYAWNGADPSLLADLCAAPGARVVQLDRNYRSTPEVLAAAGALLAAGTAGAAAAQRALGGAPVLATGDADPQHALRPASMPPAARGLPPGSVTTAVLRATRGPGPPPAVHPCATGGDETRLVCRLLRRAACEGRSWSDMAVLARTNAQVAALEEELRHDGVPCTQPGGGGIFDGAPCEEALADLRRARDSRALSIWLADLEAEVRESPLESERHVQLRALAGAARGYLAADSDGSPNGLLAWLRVVALEPPDPAVAPRVHVLTFHRAKGLEWPFVVVTGMEDGFVPVHGAGAAGTAEELRLAYVALTRAADELHLTWAARRRMAGVTVERSPSPWLAAVESCTRARPAAGANDHLSGVHAARARARTALAGHTQPPRWARRAGVAPADLRLIEALHAWRSRVAAASGLPAYMVLHDATLALLARTRPRTIGELARVAGFGPVKLSRYGQDILTVVAGAAA